MVTTQHVKSIETLTQVQNAALLAASGIVSDLPEGRQQPTGQQSAALAPVASVPATSDSVVAPIIRVSPVGGGGDQSSQSASEAQSIIQPPIMTEKDRRVDEPPQSPRKIKTRTQRKPSLKLRETQSAYCVKDESSDSGEDVFGVYNLTVDPVSYSSAMKTPQALQWQ